MVANRTWLTRKRCTVWLLTEVGGKRCTVWLLTEVGGETLHSMAANRGWGGGRRCTVWLLTEVGGEDMVHEW